MGVVLLKESGAKSRFEKEKKDVLALKCTNANGRKIVSLLAYHQVYGCGGHYNKINGSAPFVWAFFALRTNSSRGNNYDILLLTATGHKLMQASHLVY